MDSSSLRIPRHFGEHVEWHASVASTMPLAHALAARSEIASGAAVVADEQTAGKGRSGRRWESPPGRSLMVSFMLRRAEHPIALDRLGMVAALGALGACRAAGLTEARLRCKWPNDVVMLDAAGTPRKLGGILVETALQTGEWSHAVLGMGLNVNQTQEELPQVENVALLPSSLRLALEEERNAPAGGIDRKALFGHLCHELDRVAAMGRDTILRAWRSVLWMPTEEVALWQMGTLIARGALIGADEQGQLLLRATDGNVVAYAAGDLSLRLA